MDRRIHSIDLKTKTVTYVNDQLRSSKRSRHEVLHSKSGAERYRSASEYFKEVTKPLEPDALIARLCLNQTLLRNAGQLLDRK